MALDIFALISQSSLLRQQDTIQTGASCWKTRQNLRIWHRPAPELHPVIGGIL